MADHSDTGASTTCFCGAFTTRVRGTFGDVRYCHCSRCRRKSGTAFTANARVPRERWSLEGPREELREFEHAPGMFNAFCGRCGSPLYARSDADPGDIRIRIGGFDDIDVRITGHVWVGSKACWYEIGDAIPQFEAQFEERFRERLEGAREN